jgi:diguanylate cyclase (GGDEF)-like protein/PAS domain S-box-containing protein
MPKNGRQSTAARPPHRRGGARAPEALARSSPAEQARRESEDRYRVIVETTSQGVWTIDAAHRTTFANRVMAEMLGYQPGEMLGKSMTEFWDPKVVGEREQGLQRRRKGVSEQIEVPLRTKDGRRLWTLMATSPMHDPQGEYVGALAMVTDITDRKAAELERAHLAAVVRSAAVAIAGMATDGVIQSWNDAATRLYGYTEAEALGQPGWRLLARNRSERRALLARAAAGEELDELEVEDLRKDGSTIEVSLTLSPIRDPQGRVIGVSRIARDNTWRKTMERELRYLAEHDWLTGLYNRRRLMSELERCLAYTRRYGRSGAVLAIDVDNFKLVNDSRGHDAGDKTLRSIAEALVQRTRDTDVVARVGCDEFALVLPEATEGEALQFASVIRSLVSSATRPPVTVSVGISLLTPDQELTADDALVAADIAQYEAKQHGGDRALIFDREAAGTLTWVERIRTALVEHRFVLLAQPIVSLQDGLVSHHELLIRMLSSDDELILPGEFLPTAERFGLIGDIDRWVTYHALRLAISGERLTINLAGPSIGDERILDLVREAISDGLDPHNVIFEITETAAVSNFEKAGSFAAELNELGCELALDDFGTGFGSFTYLKHLDARYLKIDVEFVRNLVVNETDQKVVKAIVDIAHSLGKMTIAEGVEDAATLAALRQRGVDYAQGFYLGRPERLSQRDLGGMTSAARPAEGDGEGPPLGS